MACERCEGIHFPMKFKVGDRVRALSMMPHILSDNPFASKKPDKTGEVGIVVVATFWETIGSGSYLVNFNPDKGGAWDQAPFRECQLEPA